MAPEVEMQLCALEIFFGFCVLKASLNDRLFIQVMAAPVSNNQDMVWFLALTLILGLTFSPGMKISNSLMQVVSEARHRLSINCGSTTQLPLSGVT